MGHAHWVPVPPDQNEGTLQGQVCRTGRRQEFQQKGTVRQDFRRQSHRPSPPLPAPPCRAHCPWPIATFRPVEQCAHHGTSMVRRVRGRGEGGQGAPPAPRLGPAWAPSRHPGQSNVQSLLSRSQRPEPTVREGARQRPGRGGRPGFRARNFGGKHPALFSLPCRPAPILSFSFTFASNATEHRLYSQTP